ncbi:hypothetical protein DM860_014037 [Cuscuta australis]|uniref:C3H1-type domain-containing protein n=1 Tax=Cuscuta australis TaxID=267555 RepID=A0A328DSY1_9ASTE|nr:hypothetical protein DM860_014037 [Cuscuta australis]
MELKVSSPKRALSPSDCNSDPEEEKEISEEEDDDRNHKHRRRDAQSESVEIHAFESVITRPCRKRNKPIGNGHMCRGSESYAFEKEGTAHFEKRRGINSLYRAQQDANPRIWPNQTLSRESGPVRGRGREPSIWGQHDSRFSPIDLTTQIGQQVPVPPGFFVGRGLPNVSNGPNSHWNSFGMIPRMPIAGLDPLHPLSLQGALRTPMNPAIGLGIPRQRCKDFEERGFCLRGDMCPMEHGINRIVIEDVQSLSQFNLPVTLPNAPLLGTATRQGALSAVDPSSSLVNSKPHIKDGKFGMNNDGLRFSVAPIERSLAEGADVYDPDQPLWTSVDETAPQMDHGSSNHVKPGLSDCYSTEHPTRSNLADTVSQGVWGRINSSKGKPEIKERVGPNIDSSSQIEREIKKEPYPSSSSGKNINLENLDSATTGASFKSKNDSGRDSRKSSQKAHCTLFVSGIPQNDNRREAIISHFQKFGEVIDIYIPLKSDRAFVQFSKREAAEAALKAPDAVMGNRFIKLWWANRDNIPHNGVTSGNNAQIADPSMLIASAPPHLSVTYKGKESMQSVSKPISNILKPVVAGPAPQKKSEGLELLKELRKKQEMLDQKRNEFRRQLAEFEKQASGLIDESQTEDVAKNHKVESAADFTGFEASSSPKHDIAVLSEHTDAVPNSDISAHNALLSFSKSSSAVATPEPPSLKQSIRPSRSIGAPIFNRYKLDNRPVTFKINPPVPSGLANVALLMEHFSPFGEISSVELEEPEVEDKLDTSKISAQISFTSRLSAERAFLNAKSWQGHTMQFTWVQTSVNLKTCGGVKEIAPACSDLGVKENKSSYSQQNLDANTPEEDTTKCS